MHQPKACDKATFEKVATMADDRETELEARWTTRASAHQSARVVLGGRFGQDAPGMGRELCYDLMLEVQGVLRSRPLRMRIDRELQTGETIDLEGRQWRITRVGPARSLHVDRRAVAREIVEPMAPAA